MTAHTASELVSVLDVDARGSRSPRGIALLVTVALHIGLVVASAGFDAPSRAAPRTVATVSEMVEVDLPPLAPAAALERPPEVEPVRVPSSTARENAPDEPAPEAASAGQVLDAEPEVVDFGETFVAGGGTSFAGGTTQAGGTAQHAVANPSARVGGTPDGTGAVVGPDRSRAARPVHGGSWDHCPFPEEADEAGIDTARVLLRIDIDADGRAVDTSIMRDPGSGFGREARRCARAARYEPALDRDGRPTGSTLSLTMTFVR